MLALLVIPVMFAVAPPAATTPSPATQRELAPRVGNAAAGQLHDKLEAIDAGRDDLGGHATSFRLMPLDMRLPTSFQRVYRDVDIAKRMLGKWEEA